MNNSLFQENHFDRIKNDFILTRALGLIYRKKVKIHLIIFVFKFSLGRLLVTSNTEDA
jgi:hypothetical protein